MDASNLYLNGNMYHESESYTKFRLSDLGVFSIAKPYPAGGDDPWENLFYIQPSSARIYTSLQVDSTLTVGASIIGSRDDPEDITTNIECFNTSGGGNTGTINIKADSLNLLSEGNILLDAKGTTSPITCQLGTDTSATKFEILNNTGGTLFSIDGAGTLAPAIGGGSAEYMQRDPAQTPIGNSVWFVIPWANLNYSNGSNIEYSSNKFYNRAGSTKTWQVHLCVGFYFLGTTNGALYTRAYVNGTEDYYLSTAYQSGGEDKYSSACSELISLADDDYLEIRCRQDTNSAYTGIIWPMGSWVSIVEL
jgi:hypothetical protein